MITQSETVRQALAALGIAPLASPQTFPGLTPVWIADDLSPRGAKRKAKDEEEEEVEEEEEEEDNLGLIGNLISQQQSPQAYARNVNADNKVIIVENCEDGKVIINDNDKIIQTNTQSFNQEANNQVEEEEEEEEEENE